MFLMVSGLPHGPCLPCSSFFPVSRRMASRNGALYPSCYLRFPWSDSLVLIFIEASCVFTIFLSPEVFFLAMPLDPVGGTA